MPGLFNKKILEQRIKNYSVNDGNKKLAKIRNWQDNLQNIKGLNEIRLQSSFLKAIFENILGYENAPQKDEWTMEIQCSTDIDAKLPDGILGFYKRINGKEIKDHRAVIELKGPQISLDKDQKREGTTYKSPVDQAFSYTNKLDGCKWVIVSNFVETRLYKVGRSKEYYEVFHLDELIDEKKFKKFHYLLSKNNLISKTNQSQTMELSEATHKRHEDISVEFYNLYKNLRINLFEHLKDNNPAFDEELLLEKAQKFLDRIIFICFCEDKGLLPNDLLHEAIERGKKTFNPSQTPIWNQIRGVFKAINIGSEVHNINRYNGGLFEKDEILDNLIIDDGFFEFVYDVSDYDFDSDLDVNILGHIFEQSIADIEKIKSDINEDEFEQKESKRKKDGIYYTPKYITSYIVENSVGGYLEDIKEELGYNELPDIAEANSESWKTRYTQQHLDFYDKYENKLKEIKILDPACGSGAFLNQAFDYLLEEHQWLNKQRDILKDRYMSIDSLESMQKDILKNNLFGVDLNEESVEITKLSLWLKTANKNKPLTNLDDNIKSGNSLIEDPEIAEDKAFDWEDNFNKIMNDGGFDVIVGNPPYGADLNEKQKKYFYEEYDVSQYQLDSYVLFYEKSIRMLNNNGYLGFITPNTFFLMKYYSKLRKFILDHTNIIDVVVFEYPVFSEAVVDTAIIILKLRQDFEKTHFDENNIDIRIVDSEEDFKKTLKKHNCSQKFLQGNLNYEFNVYLSKEEQELINNLRSSSILLKEVCNVANGIKPYEKGKGSPAQTREIIDNRVYHSDYKVGPKYRRFIRGRDIFKYVLNPSKERWIKYGDNLAAPRRSAPFDIPKKIAIRQTADELICALDKNQYLSMNNVHIVEITDRNALDYYSLLGILNSRLLNFYLQNTVQEKGKTFSEVKGYHVKNLPILTYKETSFNFNQLKKKVKRIFNSKNELYNKNNNSFFDYVSKYVSSRNNCIKEILGAVDFCNKIYSGRARKVREFTVSIDANIVTLYSEKSESGKYELLKFEEDDRYRRLYIKYYLENLTEKQLEEINDKYEGNLLDKVLQIEISDYDKDHVVKKVVDEWENIQAEIKNLEMEIKQTDNEIDQMVYDLYNLTEEEIDIVENNMDK